MRARSAVVPPTTAKMRPAATTGNLELDRAGAGELVTALAVGSDGTAAVVDDTLVVDALGVASGVSGAGEIGTGSPTGPIQNAPQVRSPRVVVHGSSQCHTSYIPGARSGTVNSTVVWCGPNFTPPVS